MGANNSICACFQPEDEEGMVESSSELQKRFTDKMKKGINVKKISKDRPQFECKITLNEDETTISFEGGDSAVDPECASVEVAELTVRRATDPDPEQKHFAGSKVLRDNLDPREAMKAFIIVAKGTTTINLLGESEAEAEVLVTGFMLLIKKVKTTY